MAIQDETSTYGLDAPAHDHVSLLSVLRRRALIIVLVTLLTAGAAAAFVFTSGKTYQSTAKLLFRQTIGPEINALGLIPPSSDADNLAQNNVAIVGSHGVAAATARELQARGIDISTSDVQDDVTVSNTKDTDVVDVVAKADDADRAELLARTYSDIAQDQASQLDKDAAAATLQQLQQQYAALPPDAQNGRQGDRINFMSERLRALSDVGTGSPQLIQSGFRPSAESRNAVQTIVLGALFGLVLGVGLALVREQSDRKLRRTEQVTAAFDAPVLTTVPRSRALKRQRPFADLPPEVAEAFRMLQMNLRFARSDPVRTVLVTSARTGEGKTTVSWNLAAAAASGGLSVALVEADLRRPSLADRYGLDHSPGLTEALRGELPISEALQTSTPVGASNGSQPRSLEVVVAGAPAPAPWALMQSSVMVRVLEVLRRDHDLVVIDTPPIPHVADAISLLRHVDGVLITASVNSTRGPEANRLRDQLLGLDANVLGVVANGGSPMSGYAAYARATSANMSNGDGDGYPGTPMEVRDPTGPPRSL